MNYRTQRGHVWCRVNLTPPAKGAQACPRWDDADGPTSPVYGHVCYGCETLAVRWAEGVLLRELAAETGRSISWISNASRVHGWGARTRGGSRG